MRRTCKLSFLATTALAFAFTTAGAPLTVGPNVNISKATTDHAEQTIAINPLNPLNLFADDTWSVVGKYSTDGGVTWNTSTLPSTLNASGSIGDVSTAWDSYGNLFLCELSKTQTILVGLSTNGGASFTLLYHTSSTGNDQPTVVVGPSATPGQGSVWISYTDKSNNLIAQGAAVTGLGSVGTFSAAESAPGGGGDYGDIVIGPNGQVMVTYQNNATTEGPDNIRINVDADGLGAGGFGAQSYATATQVGGQAIIPAQPIRSIDSEAGLAWDRSGGPHQGRVYLLYTDRTSISTTDTDIYVRYSDNNGTSWSSAVRVNDDTPGNGKSQFLPRIALDQTTGYIAVSFYDCRNSPGNNTTEFWATVSTNGGVSFLPNVKVSAGVSSALVSAIVNTSFDYGDYSGLTYWGGVFYPCWADNSNSTGDNPNGANNYFDIYTAKVTVLTPPVLTNPRFSGGSFTASVLTTVGVNYYLESTPSLTTPTWTDAPAVLGNGLVQDLTDAGASSPSKFYRVRAQ